MVFKKILTPCLGLSPLILGTFNDIAWQLGAFGVELGWGVIGSTGTVYHAETTEYYGRCVTTLDFASKKTDIYISTRLLEDTPTTLYNVLYHEILHSYGLSHSQYPGLMNYSLSVDQDVAMIDDSTALWPSAYDWLALFATEKKIILP